MAVSGRDDDGRIYVADYNNRRVVRLSRNARYDGCFVAAGTSSTQLVQPQALDFAADGRLVVVDRTHVKIFDVGVRPAAVDAPAGCPASATVEAPPSSTGDVPSDAKRPPAKSKPTRIGPKPAVPPRPKFLKEMKFDDAGGQGKTTRRKTARSMSSTSSPEASSTSTSTTATSTTRTRRTSTTVIPNTPTKSLTETEVW